jgi:hypothetical protein
MKRYLMLLCLVLLVLPAVSQSTVAISGGSGAVSIQSSTVTIAIDGSLSTAADLGRLTLVAIIKPAAVVRLIRRRGGWSRWCTGDGTLKGRPLLRTARRGPEAPPREGPLAGPAVFGAVDCTAR